MNKTWMRAAAVAAAGIGLAVIAAAAQAQDVIRIGVTQPLTGAFAASGNYVTQGAKIAEDQINAAGGVLGRKIQLVVEDNKFNHNNTVATAVKLIRTEHIPDKMGGWTATLSTN